MFKNVKSANNVASQKLVKGILKIQGRMTEVTLVFTIIIKSEQTHTEYGSSTKKRV